MKTLSTAETKFVSGGFVRGVDRPQPKTQRRFMAMETTALDVDAALDAESTRQMKPAVVTDSFVPPMRFDANRTAPGDPDDDKFNGFNDQGLRVWRKSDAGQGRGRNTLDARVAFLKANMHQLTEQETTEVYGGFNEPPRSEDGTPPRKNLSEDYWVSRPKN